MKSEVMDEQAERRIHEAASSKGEQKVIVHLTNGDVLRAYINLESGSDLTAFFVNPHQCASGIIPVRPSDQKEQIAIRVNDIKSIFVVKSFQGDPKRKGVRFYTNGPTLGNIWVEIRFDDNEILEGLIENSVQHLLGDGFLLRPSDPGTNNVCIYVNKAAIKSYRVLGVKALR